MRLTARIVTAAAALVLIAPTAVSAQETEPETGEIGNGTARAAAMIARVGPAVGDLELAIRAGLAITQVTNTVAQSTGQTLDLGLIGTALTAESCGGDGLVSADQLPQSADVDNRDGPGSLVVDEGGQGASAPFAAGRKDVSTSVEPVGAKSVTTAAHVNLPGVLQVRGGEATSVTEVLPGEGREASATTKASVTIGPLTLSGLEWNAYHRSGANPEAHASFNLTGLGGLGLPNIPLDSLTELESAINTVSELLGLGLTIQFPRVVRMLEPTDMIRVTPLRITLRDSPLGNAIIAPLKVGAQPIQDQLFSAVTEAVCQAGAVMLVGDVALSVLAGTGTLSLEIGGAEASSSRFDVTSPFGEIPPFTEVPPPPVEPPPAQAAPPAPAPTTTTAAPVTTEMAAPATVPSASQGPLERFCTSVHPNGNSCSEGAALALGLLGVLVTIALAGYEIRKQWPKAGGS